MVASSVVNPVKLGKRGFGLIDEHLRLGGAVRGGGMDSGRVSEATLHIAEGRAGRKGGIGNGGLGHELGLSECGAVAPLDKRKNLRLRGAEDSSPKLRTSRGHAHGCAGRASSRFGTNWQLRGSARGYWDRSASITLAEKALCSAGVDQLSTGSHTG